jgi:hypothetical protein
MTVYVLYITSVAMSALLDPNATLVIEIFTRIPVKQLSNPAFRQLCEARIEELFSAGEIEHRLWVPHQVFTSRPHTFTSDD